MKKPSSFSAPSFSERWLKNAGVPDSKITDHLEFIQNHILRYSPHIRLLRKMACWVFEWVGPFFLLGKMCRSSSLNDSDFENFLTRSYGNRLIWIRAFFILIQLPLIESLTREDRPAPLPHPLTPYLLRGTPPQTQFDVLVIGSGAGGAPLVWDLSRRGFRIALVEKGSLPTPESCAGALEKFYVSQSMTVSTKGGITLVSAGQTIGGTTSINSGTVLRPLPECLKQWDEKYGTQFSEGQLNPWLDQAEKKLQVNLPPRELMSASSKIFEQGLKALAREGTTILPRNAPNCEGLGRCCFVCPAGAKMSTDRAFLPEAFASGMVLFAGSKAVSIKEKDKEVILEIESHGTKRTLRAKHLVIAAGALLTPGLIRKNRLGSRWSEAGKNLRIHPAVKVLAHFKNLEDDKRGVPQGLGYRPPELPRLTLEGIHVPKSIFAATLSRTGNELFWWLRESYHVASFGMLLRDRGFGRVYEWRGDPYIRYRTHPQDICDLMEGSLLLAKIFLAAGADRILFPIMRGKATIESVEDLKNFDVRKLTGQDLLISGFHPQGTAAIGKLVDTDLRLMGSRRISICDASVFPDSPGVNPMATIMALSLRLAESVAGCL